MKRLGMIGLIGILLCGCDDAAKQDDGTRNFAERSGLRESLRLKNERLPISLKSVQDCRDRVRTATSPNELAIAEDDLREARKELERLETAIEQDTRRIKELQGK